MIKKFIFSTIVPAFSFFFHGVKGSRNNPLRIKEKNGKDIGDVVIDPDDFKRLIDGKEIRLFTLKNSHGIEVKFTNYGGRIVSLVTPDKNGEMADITLGYKTIDSYLSDHMFQGALIGRYAGRISNGSFRLCELEYHLAKNNGPNTLHGGNKGFDKVVWDTELDGNNLMLTYISPDMEEGYPGILKVTARYFLNESNELSLELVAVTDKKTVVNLSNHPSFNLKGEGNGDILNHKLMINGSHINTLDENLIPTGEFMPVKGTPFDFTQAKPIGQDIDQDHPQLIAGNGYDHNWVLDKEKDQLSLAARVSEPTTGRILEIYTTDPGIQFYSGNFMDGTVGKSGKAYKVRSGFVLEPQHFPDSPNKPAFPSVVLELGEEYHHLIVFKFAVEE